MKEIVFYSHVQWKRRNLYRDIWIYTVQMFWLNDVKVCMATTFQFMAVAVSLVV